MEQKVDPGSEVISLNSGKKAGFITTVSGYRGLGLIRLEEAFKEPGNLAIKIQEDVKLDPICPNVGQPSGEHELDNFYSYNYKIIKTYLCNVDNFIQVLLRTA